MFWTLTSNEEPTTNTWSHSCTFWKTNSTVDFGTLSPKKIISGFRGPEHFGQCGVWRGRKKKIIIWLCTYWTYNDHINCYVCGEYITTSYLPSCNYVTPPPPYFFEGKKSDKKSQRTYITAANGYQIVVIVWFPLNIHVAIYRKVASHAWFVLVSQGFLVLSFTLTVYGERTENPCLHKWDDY